MDVEYVIVFAILLAATGAATIQQYRQGKKWKLGAAASVGFAVTLIIYLLGHHYGRM